MELQIKLNQQKLQKKLSKNNFDLKELKYLNNKYNIYSFNFIPFIRLYLFSLFDALDNWIRKYCDFFITK
jgi:hypothetical protein